MEDKEANIHIISMQVMKELLRATEMHGRMRSTHEGYAVILEEVDELWDEVKKKKPSTQRLEDEAIQVAAMAMRFVLDITMGKD